MLSAYLYSRVSSCNAVTSAVVFYLVGGHISEREKCDFAVY